MPPKLALFISAVFIFFAFRSDRKRGWRASSDLFWPVLWYLVVASRPLGIWLALWGVPLPGGNNDPTEGSVIDRWFFVTLTVIGIRILVRRNVNWSAFIQRNAWLVAFVAFMAASILWSQYSFVSFKRFVKVLGSIVMACVVLTETNALAAFTTVLRRCLYIHLPMSIICTRYFRDIGVSFDWSGQAESWQGIATSKNVLGQVAMLGVVYFFWELRRNWAKYRWKTFHTLYLLMGLYLLKGSEDAISMTSVSVCVFALVSFVSMQYLRKVSLYSVQTFARTMFTVTAMLVLLVVAHGIFLFSEDSVFGQIITTIGRNITLTDRTYIWTDCYAAASGNPLLGVGFGGFWIGRIANIPWNATMTWVLGQAHSGYVDNYLQLGLIGSFLLTALVLSTFPRLLASLWHDFDYACFRITLFLTILFVNMTETTYLRGDHHLWFVFMIVLLTVPSRRGAALRKEVQPENESTAPAQMPNLQAAPSQ